MFKRGNKEKPASAGKLSTAKKLLGSFLVAVALFGVLVGVERNLLSDFDKETVILCKADVQKGTNITAENVGKYFYEYEVDVKLAGEGCVTDKNELVGTVAGRTLSAHTIAQKNDFTKESEIYAGYRNPIEASVIADKPGDIVSGTIRRGDYVDIAVVNKDTLEYDVMLEHVYVLDAFTGNGERVSSDMEGTATTMLTIVEEKNHLAAFYSARELGSVIVTKLDTEN